jgi:hypothetical protein
LLQKADDASEHVRQAADDALQALTPRIPEARILEYVERLLQKAGDKHWSVRQAARSALAALVSSHPRLPIAIQQKIEKFFYGKLPSFPELRPKLVRFAAHANRFFPSSPRSQKYASLILALNDYMAVKKNSPEAQVAQYIIGELKKKERSLQEIVADAALKGKPASRSLLSILQAYEPGLTFDSSGCRPM